MEDLGRKVLELEREVRRQRTTTRICLLAVALAAMVGFVGKTGDFDLIRTKGIVVLDEQGHERILIGAPIPKSKDRVRTDLAKLKASAFGNRFKGTDFKWVATLNHDTDGMVTLDENGVDRMAIGHNIADPLIGKRIAAETGISISDPEGLERTGYGHMPALERSGLGLDRLGSEGLYFGVDKDDAGLGFSSADGKQRAYFGYGKAGSSKTKEPGPFLGWLLRDGDNVVERRNILEKK